MKSKTVNRNFLKSEVVVLCWIRLCFERLPGLPSIEESDDFREYLNRNFVDCGIEFAGYGIDSMIPKTFGSGAPHWMAILRNPSPDAFEHLLNKIDEAGREIDGYRIHACAKFYDRGTEYLIEEED